MQRPFLSLGLYGSTFKVNAELVNTSFNAAEDAELRRTTQREVFAEKIRAVGISLKIGGYI